MQEILEWNRIELMFKQKVGALITMFNNVIRYAS